MLSGALLPALTEAAAPGAKESAAPRYGSNPAAGGYFEHDGVKLYYGQYGKGQDLLIIHGNAGSIADMRSQIEYFRRHYRVIVMDSRDQGRSGDAPAPAG